MPCVLLQRPGLVDLEKITDARSYKVSGRGEPGLLAGVRLGVRRLWLYLVMHVGLDPDVMSRHLKGEPITVIGHRKTTQRIGRMDVRFPYTTVHRY